MSTPEATPGQPPTGAVPWYPVVGFPAPPPPERPRRRRLFTAVAVAWALLLLGTGLWYALHGEPTVRDQTTIAQAQPRVDEAVGTVLAAAGTGPVAAVSGFQKASDCAVTPVRAGARYQRSVLLYTAVGGEGELLSTIAAGLPPRYHARVDRSGLVADAGYYVLVTGDAPQPGVVRVIAATGCRPLGRLPAADPSAQPGGADRAVIEPVLAELHGGTVRWSTHRLPCGVRTVEAVVTAAPGSLRAALHAADAVLSADDAYAYRDAGVAVAARRAGGQVTVTATTGACQ